MATVNTVNPTVAANGKDKLSEVKVTIAEGKEVAAILTVDTDKYFRLAFELEYDQENESASTKVNAETAAKNFLAAKCNTTISAWVNLVKKFAATPKYRNTHTYAEVEEILKDNPRVKFMYIVAVKAAQIKKSL
jgi:hypothetical protein